MVDKALGQFAKNDKGLKEFWNWYESTVLQEQSLKDNIVTVAKAIEKVKENYFKGTDKCGRERNSESLAMNSLANYQTTYQTFYNKIPTRYLSKQVTAKLLIEILESQWGDLMAKKTKGFKNAHAAIQKLLIETKLLEELKIFKEHFGRIEVKKTQEIQEVSLEIFLEFRKRILGIPPYTLTKAQENQLENRQSWLKALSINLVYGFRGSEFKAIANLDESVKIGNRTFKALHDPTNTENLIVLNDRFIVIDSKEREHEVTIKTGGRICRPMIHPDYPNLIDELEIKNSDIKLPVVTPKTGDNPRTIKDCHIRALSTHLAKYAKQCGMGFTQTHALRHLCNFHGKLIGLTDEQRAESLGHSEMMNKKYKKHLDTASKADFLLRTIETPEAENIRLKQEIQHLKEQIEFLKPLNSSPHSDPPWYVSQGGFFYS
ncbi:hypothetical protein ACE1CD_26870 [Aerosakkonema sp. BLCC-F183]|uniref:hypothetical protein n=1 Tax=Aerosakkonema sp. BLCC-F183 TaxID=3342834 RepID=UPI0035B75AC3